MALVQAKISIGHCMDCLFAKHMLFIAILYTCGL